MAQCRCKAAGAERIVGDGKVRVSRESKGRGGKMVTLVRGLALSALALAELGKRLRNSCGTGGTVKDGVIEIQGDHVARIMTLLEQDGHAPKRSGG